MVAILGVDAATEMQRTYDIHQARMTEYQIRKRKDSAFKFGMIIGAVIGVTTYLILMALLII